MFTPAAGLDTHLLVRGEGAPVVLLHGAGPGVSAEINWPSLMERLGEYYRCLAPDLLGFGQTTLPEKLPGDAREWARLRADHIVRLLDSLGIEQAGFIGNSRGGGAALLHLLLDAPERCSHAVVMGSGGIPYALSSSSGAPVVDFYADPSIDAMKRLMRLFVHDISRLQEPLDDIAAHRATQALRPGAREAFSTMSKGPLFLADDIERLRNVSVPMLLLHGARDIVSPPEASFELQKIVPHAHLHILPEAGHWSHVDKGEAFSALVRAFFDGQIN